jgi:hypothetical protein
MHIFDHGDGEAESALAVRLGIHTGGGCRRRGGGQMSEPNSPNVVFFHVDNLGLGELGCYGGGLLRGANTRRIDAFAAQGIQLLNYAPKSQCTPARSALPPTPVGRLGTTEREPHDRHA